MMARFLLSGWKIKIFSLYGNKTMKKLVAGLLSVLLSANANAASISFFDYSAKLYGGTRSDLSLLESGLPPYEFTIDIDPLGSSRERSGFNLEGVNEEGKLISSSDFKEKSYDIAPTSFEHVFSENMDLLKSTFQPGESTVKVDEFDEFGINYWSSTYSELGKAAPYYGRDGEHLSLSISGNNHQSWKKNDNGLIIGQHMISQYSLTLEGDDLTTEPEFSNYDDLDELYAALEMNITGSGSFRISQSVLVFSFEKTNPNASVFCDICEGVVITDEKVLQLSSEGFVLGVDYAEVPEPSTSMLMALGLMGLMRLKRRV